jgi:hypothetical protein
LACADVNKAMERSRKTSRYPSKFMAGDYRFARALVR